MGLFAPIIKAAVKGSTPFTPRANAPSSVQYTTLTPQQQAAIAPMSNQQIGQDAQNTATQEINSQIAPLQGQQATAAATAAAQAQSTQAFNQAASKLLGSVGPQAEQGYNQAAQETSQLAQGFSAPLRATLTDEQNQQQLQAAQLGVTGQNMPQNVNPAAFGDALKMGNGFIPSSNLLAQGAAANQWGTGLQAVNTDVGRAQLQNEQTTENSTQAKISQQIAEVAAKYPQLFTAQEHADIAQNTANIKTSIAATSAASTIAGTNARITYETNETSIANMNANTRITVANNAALAAQNTLKEKQWYDTASIKVRGQLANNALMKIQQTGGQVDKNSSLALGYIVLKDGSVPNVKGQPIPIDPRAYGSQSTANTPTVQYSKAVKSAAALIGTPVVSTQESQTFGGGKYLLDPSLNPTGPLDSPGRALPKGEGSLPATTNDPARAEKDTTVTFAQAVTRIMGEYPLLTRSKARAAVVAAGLKPDGKRTAPTSTGLGIKVGGPGTTDPSSYVRGTTTTPSDVSFTTGASSTGTKVAQTALSQLGQPYLFGGLAKLGHDTDCSGLLQESLAAVGVSIPRDTYSQWQTGTPVPVSDLQAGDAVFFRGSDPRGNLPGHVGIYLGNGKYINDPHTGGVVSIRTLDIHGTGTATYAGARRYTPNAGATE